MKLGLAGLLLSAAAFGADSKVEIDNQWVRVLRVKEAPHEKIAAQRHPATLRVFLADTHLRFTGSGQPIEIRKGAGDVSYLEAGEHAEENLSDSPAEIAVIELKPNAPHGPKVELDPTVLDAVHHPILFENDKIRAIKTILEPHLKSPEHDHPHYVVVYITELHTSMKMADGRMLDNPRHPGDIAWRDALRHVTENIDQKTAVEVQVEIK